MAEYDIGQAITSTVTFRDTAGVATDPTTVTVSLLDPAGTSTTPTITTVGTGVRSITFTPTTVGTHVVRWVGTGAVADSESAIYVVRPAYAWDPLALLTLDEAKRAVSLETDDATHDIELYQAVVAISRRIDARCGPVVRRTITDERHDRLNGVLFPRYTPVASVSTVTEYASGAPTVLTAEDHDTAGTYLLTANGHNVQIARRTNWYAAPFLTSPVLITYSAGRYATTAAVDPRFKVAAMASLRRWWAREAGAWARTPTAFAETDTPFVGFFKVVDPVVDELLADELLPPSVA